MDTPKIPRTSERSARRRRRTAWTVVGQPDSPAQSPGDVPEGWKRPERHLPDQGTMSSPPHLGRGEVSMTQENPDRREVVATAAPRSGNSPIDGGSPAGESASRVSGPSRRATQPVGPADGSSGGASEEVRLLRQQLAEMREQHAAAMAAMAAMSVELLAVREGRSSSDHLPTVGSGGPRRPVPSPRTPLSGTPGSRTAVVGGVRTPPRAVTLDSTPLPMVGREGRRTRAMPSPQASPQVTSLSPRPKVSRTDAMEVGVSSPPRLAPRGERDVASPTLMAGADGPSPPRTYAQVVAGFPAASGKDIIGRSPCDTAARPALDGAFSLLQRQMATMKDTLRCVEERIACRRSEGSGSSHGGRGTAQPQHLPAPPHPTRVIAEPGLRTASSGSSGLRGALGAAPLVSSPLDSTAAMRSTPSTRSESMLEVKEQLVEIANAYRAPPVSITPFSGEPMDFPRFREEVRAGIEATIPPNKGRLARLLAVLKGDAKLLCTNLHMFGDQPGFEVGMQRLGKRYGHLPTLVNAWRQKLASARRRTCQEWYLELQGCVDALQASNALRMMGTGQALKDVVEHLPDRVRKAYAAKVASAEEHDTELPGLEALLTIVRREASLEAAEAPYRAQTGRVQPAKRGDQRPPGRVFHARAEESATRKDTRQCTECKGSHEVTECRTFSRLPLHEKRKRIQTQRLCFRCMGPGHRAANCPSEKRCQECGGLHATAAHSINASGRRGRTPPRDGQKRKGSPLRGKNGPRPSTPKRRKNGRPAAARNEGQTARGEVHTITNGQE